MWKEGLLRANWLGLGEFVHESKKALATDKNVESATKFMDFYGDQFSKLSLLDIEFGKQIQEIDKQLAELTTPVPVQPTENPVAVPMKYTKSNEIYLEKELMMTKPVAKMKAKKMMYNKRDTEKKEKEGGKIYTYYVEESQGKKKIFTKQFTVTLYVTKKTKAKMYLSYMCQSPATKWVPTYDMHFNASKNSVEVAYHVNIYNSSREDWKFEKNTQVFVADGPRLTGTLWHSMQTGMALGVNPVGGKQETTSFRFSKPNLSMTTAPLPTAAPVTSSTRSNSMSMTSKPSQPKPPAEVAQPQTGPAVQQQQIASLPAVSYRDPSWTVLIPVPLPSYGPIELASSDKESLKLTVDCFQAKAVYTYNVLPKVSNAAFMQGFCLNTFSYPLMPGVATMYVDNKYKGHADIGYVNPQYEFQLPLGSDSEITVDFKQEQTVDTKSNKTKLIYLINTFTIQNSKALEVELNVYDLMPTSSYKDDAKITTIKPNLKEDKSVQVMQNQLKWTVKVASGKAFQEQSIYQIEVAKDSDISMFC